MRLSIYAIYGIGLSEYGYKKSHFFAKWPLAFLLSAGVDQVSVMGEEPGAPEESAQSDVEIAGAEQGEEWD